MTEGSARWLLDTCLPRNGYEGIDVIHANELTRLPGPAGLREARALGRTLVTCDSEFRGEWSLPLDHPGIVIFQTAPVDGPEVVRNLQHLAFRIEQYGGAFELTRNRFLISSDREVYRITPDGREVEIEPWREVRLQVARAFAV